MDPRRNVQKGQKLKGSLSAEAWNLLLGTLKDGGDTGAGGLSDEIVPANTAIMVWGGAASATLKPFSVLGYGTPASRSLPQTNPFLASGRPLFASAAPSATLPFAITLRPVTGGNAVKVAVSGLVSVQVDVSNSGHTRARPIASNTDKLESCAAGVVPGGVPIVYKESGTGVKWAIVLLDFSDNVATDPHFTQTNFNDTFGANAYDTLIGGSSSSFSTGVFTTHGAFVTATGYIDRSGTSAVQQRIGIAVMTAAQFASWSLGTALPSGLTAYGWIVVNAVAGNRTNFMVGGAISFNPGTYTIGCAVENVSGSPPAPSGGTPALPLTTNISIGPAAVT